MHGTIRGRRPGANLRQSRDRFDTMSPAP